MFLLQLGCSNCCQGILSPNCSQKLQLDSFWLLFFFVLWNNPLQILFQVTECHLVTDPRTRESRGFAFVTMETVEGADRCIKYLNRSVLEGRLITVEKVLFTNIFVLQCSVVRVTDLEFSLKVPLQKCCLINFGSRSCMCNFIEFSVRSKQLNLPHHDMCSASTFETHRFKFDCFAGGCTPFFPIPH